MTCRFVSNVDGPTSLREAVRDLDPAETLFIDASKTFTTLETMTNAHTARAWLLAGSGGRSGRRQAFCRCLDKRRGSGAVRDRYGQHVRVLGLGRRALLHDLRHRPRPCWPLVRALPRPARRLPPDGRALPHRPFERNLPVLMGLLGVWYTDFFGAQSVAVLPCHEQYLKRSRPISSSSPWRATANTSRAMAARSTTDRPHLLGRAGHQRPHSFYQLIHQGTPLIP